MFVVLRREGVDLPMINIISIPRFIFPVINFLLRLGVSLDGRILGHIFFVLGQFMFTFISQFEFRWRPAI